MVQPTGSRPAPARRGAPAALGVVAAIALAGWLALAGGSATTPSPTTEPPPLSEEPEAELVAAVGVARGFEEALSSGDLAAVPALFSDDPLYVELPGTGSPLLHPGAGVAAAVAFSAETTDVEFGSCTASPARTGTAVDYTVTCRDVVVRGDYATALGREGEGQQVVVGVGDGRIVSVFWSHHGGDERGLNRYCVFARSRLPGPSDPVFDAACRPIEGPGSAQAHRMLAAAFVAAGRPGPADGTVEEVRALELVEAFVAAHDEGDDASRFLDRDFNVVRFPGLLLDDGRPPFPRMSDFLDWSGEMYRIDLGNCRRSSEGSFIRVDCPGAVWGGPFVTALGLDPVPQPIAFLVSGFQVTGLFGDTAIPLRDAFVAACPALGGAGLQPGTCVPEYTVEGAASLLAALGG